jgi:cell division protein FtsB
MVVFIVLIVMIGGVLKAKYSHRNREIAPKDDAEAVRMREEIKMLRDRLAVLERITIEKENSLEREIEQLRDR